MTLLQSDKGEHIRIHIRAGGEPLHWRNEHTRSLWTVYAHVFHRCVHTRTADATQGETQSSSDYHKKSLMPAHASLV